MSEIAKIHGDDIRDKKLMEAKEASGTSDITSQCKFLLEKGDTGEFMKVLETYIDEKIRSALGALLNNLDKGTGVKAVAGIDNNNDLGSVTLANLASVLSARDWKSIEISNGQTKTLPDTEFGTWEFLFWKNLYKITTINNAGSVQDLCKSAAFDSYFTISLTSGGQIQVKAGNGFSGHFYYRRITPIPYLD